MNDNNYLGLKKDAAKFVNQMDFAFYYRDFILAIDIWNKSVLEDDIKRDLLKLCSFNPLRPISASEIEARLERVKSILGVTEEDIEKIKAKEDNHEKLRMLFWLLIEKRGITPDILILTPRK